MMAVLLADVVEADHGCVGDRRNYVSAFWCTSLGRVAAARPSSRRDPLKLVRQDQFDLATTWPGRGSLPFNRSGRLGGHVIDDAVDPTHFIDDAGRNPAQEAMLERIIIRRHA